jgi:hypothetical protein
MHAGAGIVSPASDRAHALDALQRYTLPELHTRLSVVQQLREMNSQHVNKKMIFEYLTFAL